jgi:hypothetical protein
MDWKSEWSTEQLAVSAVTARGQPELDDLFLALLLT